MKLCNISPSYRAQLQAVLCVNIVAISHGMTLGWLSPTLPVLQSNETPLDSGPLTTAQTSWIASFVTMTGVVGVLLFTYISDKYGKKFAMSFLGMPHIGFWLMVLFGTKYYHLYIGRLMSGLSTGGVVACIPLYIGDIAEPDVRGRLGSVLQLCFNIGILVSYLLGTLVTYRIFPIVALIFPLTFTIVVFFLPETPQSLIKLNKLKNAEISQKFYRGIKKIDPLPKIYQDEFELFILKTKEAAESKFEWNDFKSKDVMKGLSIGLVLFILQQFSGCFTIISYAATIFRDAGSSLSPNLSSIILAIMQIAGCYASTLLVDRAGRKILLLVSTISVTIGLSVLGIFILMGQLGYDVTQYASIPVISLSFVIFMACLGVFSVPFIIMVEVLPLKMRSIGSTISLVTLLACAFLILKFFPIINEAVHLYGSIFMFAGVSALGTLFIVFVVPETKGKSLF